jgi:hypothetical protein
MNRRTGVLTIICLCSIAPAIASASPVQFAACTPPSTAFAEDTPLAAPAEATTFQFGSPDGKPLDSTTHPNPKGQNPPKTAVVSFLALRKQRPDVGLLWSTDGKPSCFQKVETAGAGAAPEPQSQPADEALVGVGVDRIFPSRGAGYESTQCARAGNAFWMDIRRQYGSDVRLTVIVFNRSSLCFDTTRGGGSRTASHGDPIHVGLFTDQWATMSGSTVEFDPCSPEPASPTILISGGLPQIKSLRQAADWRIVSFLPETCWNDQVGVTLKTGDSTARASVRQYARYLATLHLGTIFSELHDGGFGLRPDGTTKRIFEKGPTDRGPEYLASLVIYAAPRHLASLLHGRVYKGREIRNEKSFADRVGFTAGVGLSSPSKRFFVGGAFELFAGLNVLVGEDLADVAVLPEGVEVDSVFVGEEKDIPVQRQWKGRLTFGISFDLAYAAALFK